MARLTIDDLGIPASTRYAEDQKNFDKTLIEQAASIPAQTEIDVTSSFFPKEMEEFLPLQPLHISWALFTPPRRYSERRKRLFTSFQLIPSIGSPDKNESLLTKIQSVAKETPKTSLQDRRQKYEAKRALEQEEKEKKTLISLLETIAQFDKVIIEINSRRTQYQKG